jgi:hypothetical protein
MWDRQSSASNPHGLGVISGYRDVLMATEALTLVFAERIILPL